jgi:hypothetical protein
MYPIPPFLSTTKLRFNGRLDPGKFFPVNNPFPFPLATAKSIGDVWMNRQSEVKMFLAVIIAPIVLAHLIDFYIGDSM